VDNFVTILLQIHSGICVPKIILFLTWFDKVKQKGAVFLPQCRSKGHGRTRWKRVLLESEDATEIAGSHASWRCPMQEQKGLS